MGLPPPRRARPATQETPQPGVAAAKSPEETARGAEVIPIEANQEDLARLQRRYDEQTAPRFIAPETLDFPAITTELEALKPQCASIDFRTRDGYEAGKAVLSKCTKLRSGIEAKRKELKEPALAWGKKVDEQARQLTAVVEELEQPLKERKLLVDREEEARRREADRAEREANERAAQEAAAERAKLEAERMRLEGLKAEQLKLEEQWAKKHGLPAPTPEVEKGEPMGKGPPPRRPQPGTPGATSQNVGSKDEQSQAVPLEQPLPEAHNGWTTLVKVTAKGFGFSSTVVGAAVQFSIHGIHRGWHGTGNTLGQAVEQAWERHNRAPADEVPPLPGQQ